MRHLRLRATIVLACAAVAALGWITPLHAAIAAVILFFVVPPVVNLLLGAIAVILYIGLSLAAALFLGPHYEFERRKNDDKSPPIAL